MDNHIFFKVPPPPFSPPEKEVVFAALYTEEKNQRVNNSCYLEH